MPRGWYVKNVTMAGWGCDPGATYCTALKANTQTAGNGGSGDHGGSEDGKDDKPVAAKDGGGAPLRSQRLSNSMMHMQLHMHPITEETPHMWQVHSPAKCLLPCFATAPDCPPHAPCVRFLLYPLHRLNVRDSQQLLPTTLPPGCRLLACCPIIAAPALTGPSNGSVLSAGDRALPT